MRELITKVIGWAEERNLIKGSSPAKQLDKTSEEFNELQRAIAGLRWSLSDREIDSVMLEVKDGFGDVLVTLIIAAAQLGVDLEDCLAGAYEEIKDRKGKMINGKFVKEADLV